MKWKRIVTGVVAVAAFVVTAFAVSASDSTLALANSAVGRTLPPLTAPLTVNKPTISLGTGQTAAVLVTASGQALYFNDQDTAFAAACTGTCAAVWQPLVAPANKTVSLGPGVLGTIATIQRPNGSAQITYDGRPLYTYSVDAIGHVTGDGLIDAYVGRAYSWHAVTASGQPLTSPSAPPSAGAPAPSGPPSAPPTPAAPAPSSPTPTPNPVPAPNPTIIA
jgi:predicted lipoprotein with Yx(FWY)xxD motif